MNGEENKNTAQGNSQTGASARKPDADIKGKTVSASGDERTMVMPTSRIPPVNLSGRNNQTRRNLSACFSLEVFRKKTPNNTQKKKTVDEYFGRKLTRYTSIPIDNTSEIDPDIMPQLDRKYQNLEIFDEGGQGIISAARENALGRIVALKTLRTTESEKSSAAKDFIVEAKVTAQLDHPSIIPIYAIGKDKSDHLQLAMKLVNGKTLREHLKNISLNYRMHGITAFDERTSLYKRLELFLHVCDAMVYAHHRRIMHCDLKPENIMIGEYWEVYLMDWGLAKPIPDRDDQSEWVRPETIAGTPRYLSPEAVVGDRFDERADIFALGLILQEITTLQYAVSGEDSTEVMNRIKDGLLNEPVHLYGYPIDRDLLAVIRKATAYRKEDRYQSVRELADDLRDYMQGNEVSANPDHFFMKMARWMNRHRSAMLISIFIALATALAAVSFSIYQSLQQTRRLNERSEMINRAYGQCFAATSLLDREILAQEKNITLLAGLAARLLSNWTVHDEKSRFKLYKKSGELMMPADSVYSPGYADMISFSEGMCKAVPELKVEKVQTRIQQLSPLIFTMREVILGSGAELTFFNEDEQLRLQRAIQEGLAVKSIYIGLKEGIQFGYPWRNIYKGNFDPRKRPWYIRGKETRRPVWGKPYVGLDYRIGLCLPCSMRIQDEKGNFYGVVGLDLTFNKVAEILHHSGNTGYYVLDSTLIDAKGRIIASSDRKKRKKEFTQADSERNQELTMEYYAFPKIRYGILEQKHGILSDHEPGRGEVLYLFAQMKTLDWICVQKIDFEAYRNYFRRNVLLRKNAAMQMKKNGKRIRQGLSLQN
ncbi:MAG: protein kinase [Lentisphaeria bacterium]|nr:protein kinase [Lentisphaeria bacterium]